MPHPRDLRPGPVIGTYPERRRDPPPDSERLLRRAAGTIRTWLIRTRRAGALPMPLARAMAAVRDLDDARLLDRAIRFRGTASGRTNTASVATALALAIEAIRRSESIELYPVQWIGAAELLRGRLVEMQTGEGKSLVFVAAALALALHRIPVHVMTVNDYLVERDAAVAGRTAALLGLTAAAVTPELDDDARRQGYGADVTYVTNKQLGFDYLRDRLAGPDAAPLLRGLCAGLIDEADSVLVDEARTALIISSAAAAPASDASYAAAAALADALEPGEYLIDLRDRRALLTRAGRRRIAQRHATASNVAVAAMTRVRLEELVMHALAARHCFARDRDYVIEDGRIVIVDANTGRKLPDRRWDADLHRLVEVKEGLAAAQATQPLASISLQRLLPRYRLLAGATGTAMEVAAELWAEYGLATTRLPTHRRCLRRREGIAIHRSGDTRDCALLDAVVGARRRGRPVLVGTPSVEASQHISRLLSGRGIEHAVLNGVQTAQEAAIIEAAGAAGCVTVATNIAGRGTDIRLSSQARSAGGLLVVATTFHDSGRIDRQLIGRCARQGDPGGYIQLAALEDPLFRQQLPRSLLLAAGSAADRSGELPRLPGRALLWLAQRLREAGDARERDRLIRAEARRFAALGFIPESRT